MPEVTTDTGDTATVSRSTLETQIAAESRNSIRSPFQRFLVNSITPSRLGIYLRGAANWNQQQYMEFAEDVEERDPHYRSVLQTRKMAVTGLPWQVTPASESPADMEVAEFCTTILNRRGFVGAMRDCLDGLAKGFAVVEIVWEFDEQLGKTVPAEYIWRDPRYFSYDYETMTKVQLRTTLDSTYGVPLEPAKFLTHVPGLKSGKIPRSGLVFTVAALYLCKSYILKDWMAFSEVFGMPIRYGQYSENATEDEKTALIRALQSIGSDASAIISKAAELEMLGVNTTNHGDFYEKAQRFFNQEISKVVLGQTMTTEDGSSLAQAKVHGEVRTDIRNADAMSLAETINTYLIGPLVEMNYGMGVELPKFVFDVSESEDLVALTQTLIPLIDRGFRVSTAELYERTGFSPPEDSDEVLTAMGAAAMTEDRDATEEPEDEEQEEEEMDGEFMSASEAAARLGIGIPALYGMVAGGEIVARIAKSGRRRFKASDLEAMEVRASSPFEGTATQ